MNVFISFTANEQKDRAIYTKMSACPTGPLCVCCIAIIAGAGAGAGSVR